MTVDDYQRLASVQGRSFEELCEFMLKAQGWAISARHAVVAGAEIDLIAWDPQGVEWWVECKGSHRGHQPGCKRGDTVKKAVGVAAYLATMPDRRPYMLFTSHLPNPGTLSHEMLRVARAQGWFADIRVAGFAVMAQGEAVD